MERGHCRYAPLVVAKPLLRVFDDSIARGLRIANAVIGRSCKALCDCQPPRRASHGHWMARAKISHAVW